MVEKMVEITEREHENKKGEEESVEIKTVKWAKLKEKDSEKGVRNELSPPLSKVSAG